MKHFSALLLPGLLPIVALLTKQPRRIILFIGLLFPGSHSQLLQAQSCPGTTVAGQTGQGGSAANLLNQPVGVAVDQAGNIYVADYLNSRIQKFPPNATAGTNGSTVAGATGMRSGAANRLNWPQGLTVDQAGYIYVADYANHRIQKFRPTSTSATAGTTVAGVTGQQGSAANNLNYPIGGVAVDQAGYIYVTDTYNHRVQKFPPNSTSATAGTTVAGVTGQAGSAANQLYYPEGVVVDQAGYIYVVDNYNHRIQKFSPNSTSATSGTTVAGGQYGFEANQLAYPRGVAIDQDGNIYVADKNNNRIQKFPPNSTSATNGVTVAGTGLDGSAANELNYPTGVAVDQAGNVYIADATNHRIQKFATTPPGVSLTVSNAGVLTCSLPTLTLTAGSSTTGVSYSFASPRSFTEAGNSILINRTGTYSVTAVNPANGCISTTTTTISSNTARPGVSLTATNNGVLTCSYPVINLTASSSTGGATFRFDGPAIVNTSPTAVSVNGQGTYSVTATNPANGCVRSTTTSVRSSTDSPGLSFSATNSGLLTCGVQTLTLTANSSASGVSYSFASANSFTQVANSIIVNLSGLYSVSAIATTGCYSVTSLAVGTNYVPPGAISVSQIGAIGCGPNSVTLIANASGALAYSLNGSSGSSNGQFVINAVGTYTITASNGEPTSCRSQTIITIDSGTPARIGEITILGQATCETPTRLTASGTGSAFIFTGPGNYVFSNVYRTLGTYNAFATDVIIGGMYTLTVYSTEGCPPVSRSILVSGPVRCP